MKVTSQLDYIEKEIDSFYIRYSSLDLDIPKVTGTKPEALIICYNKNELVAVLGFSDGQPLPVNSYRGTHTPYMHINFYISRFDDIISILQNQMPLTLWFDLRKSDGELAPG